MPLAVAEVPRLVRVLRPQCLPGLAWAMAVLLLCCQPNGRADGPSSDGGDADAVIGGRPDARATQLGGGGGGAGVTQGLTAGCGMIGKCDRTEGLVSLEVAEKLHEDILQAAAAAAAGAAAAGAAATTGATPAAITAAAAAGTTAAAGATAAIGTATAPAATTAAAVTAAAATPAPSATAAAVGNSGLAFPAAGGDSFCFSKVALAQLYHAELMFWVARGGGSAACTGTTTAATPVTAKAAAARWAAAAGGEAAEADGAGAAAGGAAAAAAAAAAGMAERAPGGVDRAGEVGVPSEMTRGRDVIRLSEAASVAWSESGGKIVTTLQVQVKEVGL